MKTYTCPHCNKEQTQIKLYFEHHERVCVETGAIEYEDTGFDFLADAECPDCDGNLKEFVEGNEELYNCVMQIS